MNKKLFILSLGFFVLFLFTIQSVSAQSQYKKTGKNPWWSTRGDYDWGAGFRLGEPTGFTFRKFMRKSALDVVAGIPAFFYASKVKNARFEQTINMHLAVHYAYRGVIHHNQNMHFTLGGGAMIQNKYVFADHDNDAKTTPLRKEESVASMFYGPSFLLGGDYHFPGSDMSMFFDLNPTIEISSGLGFYPVLYAGTGLRFLH